MMYYNLAPFTQRDMVQYSTTYISTVQLNRSKMDGFYVNYVRLDVCMMNTEGNKCQANDIYG